MPAIEVMQRVVYRSPTSRRTFLTAKSAARSEAAKLIIKKYPTENAEYENGFCYYSGFHWREDEQLVRVHARLVRLIMRRLRQPEGS